MSAVLTQEEIREEGRQKIQKVPYLNSYCSIEKDMGAEKGVGGGVVLGVWMMIKGLLPHTSLLIQIRSKKILTKQQKICFVTLSALTISHKE